MNKIISDTAEYGCYLFDHACKPLLKDFMNDIENNHIGEPFELSNKTNNQELIKVNDIIRNHPVELIGKKLRASMTSMKQI
jgi:ketol-acid reductoisomerase